MAFYDWYNSVKNDSLLMDTITKTPNYKKFRRFEAIYESQLDVNGSMNSFLNEPSNHIFNYLSILETKEPANINPK